MDQAILLFVCPDQKGLVSTITNFISEKHGNILSLNEYVDTESSTFFLRLEWEKEGLIEDLPDFENKFKTVANSFKGWYRIYNASGKTRTALFVSKYDHCLRDILWRYTMNEFRIEIPLIISNHKDLEHIGARYQIPYYYFPINKNNKTEVEKAEIEILRKNNIDSIVLARYMQILSPDFVTEFLNRIINIHHSFLPAFVGGNPYKQAFQRGVKIIGATSHYVTGELDEGPIIVQDISHISHRDKIDDLIRKGRDLERLVLARALRLHSEHRVLVFGRKTVVFE
ncbi:MAG: formyltetrahydrofolate deformylase [Bacteroidota bacterium]